MARSPQGKSSSCQVGGDRHYLSRDKIFLKCQVILQDHATEEPYVTLQEGAP